MMTNAREFGWFLGFGSLLCLMACSSGGGGGNGPGSGGNGGTAGGKSNPYFCESICGMMASACTGFDKPGCVGSCEQEHVVGANCIAVDNAYADCTKANGIVTCTPPTVDSTAACADAQHAVENCNSGSGTGGGSSTGGSAGMSSGGG